MDAMSLTPLGLFLAAGPVGKLVLILLAAASLWCWLVIVEAIVVIRRLGRVLGDGAFTGPLEPIAAAGAEAARLTVVGESYADRRRRIAEAMTRAAQAIMTHAEGGLANLAVIASVSPFVGLFGTVWGIMSSFAGIAVTKDTSLAVVAPGIAEALAATAFGLAAAIPASIGYARLGAAFARLGERLGHRLEDRAVQVAVPVIHACREAA